MEPHFPMPEAMKVGGKKEDEVHEAALVARLDDILSRQQFFEALKATEYESASEAHQALKRINEWRKQARQSPAREFYHLVEHFSLLEAGNFTVEEKKWLTGYLADQMTGNVVRLGDRARDVYQALLAHLEGSHYEPQFAVTQKKIAEMQATNDIEYLTSSSVSMGSKLEYLEKRFDKYIAGANALDGFEDKREAETMSEEERAERKEKLENESVRPATDTNESKPSMDKMSRLKEGEKAQAIWTIAPTRGGYYREQALDTWDPLRRRWTSDETRIPFTPQSANVSPEKTFSMTVALGMGEWVKIACPYTHEFVGVASGNTGFQFRHDGSGGMSIFREQGSGPVALLFAPKTGGRHFTEVPRLGVVPDDEHFTSETEVVVGEIRKKKKGNMAVARGLARYTRERLTYSNDDQYNAVYDGDPQGYCFAIDTHKQADCDVANTYFAGLCRKAGVPVRHVVGHMVKGRYEGDTSAITSGTGHAWSEIWDEMKREWFRIDATPAGDPNMEEEKQASDGEPPVSGDYGDEEAVGRSDQELEKLAGELAKHVEQLSYTPAERKLAEDTGIELKEAREIMREIQLAEDTHLPDGRRITDALAQLFDMIVESRKHFGEEYTGPLRRRDGGEHIDDIVRHYIGTQAGEADPVSRTKEKEVPKEEKLFGGFDVYLIGDKSGSMQESVEGETKWQMQRRALYLILSALHRFEEKLARSGVQSIAGQELDIRTESISFRGEAAQDIDTDKQLSATFGSSDKVKLWHSLTGQGGGNGDVTALQMIHHEISEEIKTVEATGKRDNRLRIVIATTDGYPDSVTGVHRMAEALGKQGAVVVGVGLTKSAKGVEQIYTTPFSRGDYAESIDDLPKIVAKYVILEAMKLFPEKAQEQNKRALEMLMRGFA